MVCVLAFADAIAGIKEDCINILATFSCEYGQNRCWKWILTKIDSLENEKGYTTDMVLWSKLQKKKKKCNLTTFALFRFLQVYNLHDFKATMHSSETGFPKSFEFIK